MGSTNATRLAELRRALSEYRRLSWWAALTAEPALDLYAQFGRGVARDMINNQPLREAMLWYAVVPACHMLQLAEAHLAADENTAGPMRATTGSLREYVEAFVESGRSAESLDVAADGALAASRCLASGSARSVEVLTEPVAPGQLYRYLTRAIVSQPGTPDAFAWGLEGLAMFLRAAASTAQGRQAAPAELAASLSAWTARPPLPPAMRFDVSSARQELRILGERPFRRADTRMQFAEHLLTRWPGAPANSLLALLRELGYLPAPAEARDD